MLFHDMALMDLTYIVKQTCQKSHFWPFYSKKVHVCHCKANGFFLMLSLVAMLLPLLSVSSLQLGVDNYKSLVHLVIPTQ